MNRIKGYIYDLISFAAQILGRKAAIHEKVLILRVDEIGDYLLWRKFLQEIVSSNICKEKQIHFLGNASWKSLFELEFDTKPGNPFAKVIWLDKGQYKKNMAYRFKINRMLFIENYQTIINPTYSRAKRVDDSLVKAAKAKINYGFVRNNENYLPYEQSFDLHLYQHVFTLTAQPLFEFNSNKLFTAWITGQSSNVHTMDLASHVQLPSLNESLLSKTNYFVVFPGSRSPKRIWSAQNFIQLSNTLFEKYQYTAVIAGAGSDQVYAEAFIAGYAHPYINLIGKTNLKEMLSVLKNAKCLLSVDTGSIHMAATVNCTTIGIFNGSQYGRFSPYPSDICNKIHSCYPLSIQADLNDIQVVREKYTLIVPIDYNEVSAAQAIEKLASLDLN
ncbi:MAG: hypothetical protein RLZ56_420 [Bacteroidota bacterium]